MSDANFKEVYFSQYCNTCMYEKKKETEDPCYECLMEGARLYSHKPVNYKEAVKKNGGQKLPSNRT